VTNSRTSLHYAFINGVNASISHGQATVERGFLINKQVETDNLIGSTFEAKRLVCDHTAAVGGICNIKM
jgi:hypothetical protein